MQKLFWVLLLGILLLTSFTRAQDEEEGGEEAPAKPAKKADELPTSLPPLKLEPLSSDSPILKDDDTMFDSLKDSKILNAADSIKSLTLSLKRASTLMRKMKLDLEGEKLWAKQVYDIIQNYEVKYSRTLKDIKLREKKVKLLVKLVGELKASTLQANVAEQLKNAKKALGELTARSGKDAKQSKQYKGIQDQIAKLQKTLSANKAPIHSETAHAIHEILRSEVPPAAADALKTLVAEEASFIEEESEEEEDAEETQFVQIAEELALNEEDEAEEEAEEEETEETEFVQIEDEEEAEEEEEEEEEEDEQEEEVQEKDKGERDISSNRQEVHPIILDASIDVPSEIRRAAVMETLSTEEMQERLDQFSYIMQEKFLLGEDNLDYSKIDEDETLDDHWIKEANYDAEEKYFDDD